MYPGCGAESLAFLPEAGSFPFHRSTSMAVYLSAAPSERAKKRFLRVLTGQPIIARTRAGREVSGPNSPGAADNPLGDPWFSPVCQGRRQSPDGDSHTAVHRLSTGTCYSGLVRPLRVSKSPVQSLVPSISSQKSNL